MQKAKKIIYERITKQKSKFANVVLQNVTVQQIGGNTEAAVAKYLQKKFPGDQITVKQIDWA